MNENIKVKSLSATIVLSTALILVLSLCLWLFTGTVTEKSYVKGVIFPVGGTTDATLPQGGVVRSMFVQKGQEVRKDELLVKIVDTDLRLHISELESVETMTGYSYTELRLENARSQLESYVIKAPFKGIGFCSGFLFYSPLKCGCGRSLRISSRLRPL